MIVKVYTYRYRYSDSVKLKQYQKVYIEQTFPATVSTPCDGTTDAEFIDKDSCDRMTLSVMCLPLLLLDAFSFIFNFMTTFVLI